MKKIFLAAFAVSLMTTSLMAAVIGNVGSVQTYHTGVIKVTISTTTKALVGTPDAIQSMMAMILTAKSTTATISATPGTATDGSYGWVRIEIQ